MAITPGSLMAGAMLFYSIAWGMFLITAGWVIYAKAKQPGWSVLIPYYNTYIFLVIVGRPWWWLLLYFVPVVGMVVAIINVFDLVRVFGQPASFGFGILFLSPIFLPMLAFGDAEYTASVQTGWQKIDLEAAGND
jgi:hypothetical protein